MNTPKNIDRLIQKASIALFFGGGIWIGLLIHASMFIQNEKAAAYKVTCGPFLLNTITRHQDSHGVVASIDFHTGLLWFAVICICVGLSVGGFQIWKDKH